MLNSFSVSVTVGAVLGFLAGLGVGGGSLLMLWLTLVLGLSHESARWINLLFFIPTAVISCLFRNKQGTLNIRSLLPAILSSAVTAIAGSYCAHYLQVTALKKIFGLLLILAGIRELTYRARKAK